MMYNDVKTKGEFIMFCKKCGAEIDDQAVICVKCGCSTKEEIAITGSLRSLASLFRDVTV